MYEKGFTSHSALARKMWGETTDKHGKVGAAHRDRLSVWLAGQHLPTPANMRALAAALGVSMKELSKPLLADIIDRERSSLQMIQAAGHPDKVHLRVDKLVDIKIAVQVLDLLTKHA